MLVGTVVYADQPRPIVEVVVPDGVMRVVPAFTGGRWGGVYVKNVGNGPLAYRAGLPELLPTVGQLATAQGDDGIGAADSPAHPRLL